MKKKRLFNCFVSPKEYFRFFAMKYVATVFFLLVWSTAAVFGQALYSVKGIVTYPGSGEPVQGSTVLLKATGGDSTVGALTDEKGMFILKDLSPGSYQMKVSFTGFEALRQSIELENRNLDLGKLALGERVFEMDQVVIEGEEATAEQRGDTVEYNASAFTTNPDASAQDLIQKMPGILMQNGQIQAQGEAVQQVLVDGKPFFGNDPSAALANLPADVVKGVQVIDQQSDQAQFTGFQDGETTKAINIITKPEKRIGVFGRAYAGYGQPEDRYRAGGSMNFFNGDQRTTLLLQSNNVNQQGFAQEDLMGVTNAGRRRWGRSEGDFDVSGQNGITTTQALGLNYSDEWAEGLEVTASYFLNYGDNMALQELERTFLVEGDTGQIYREYSEVSRQNLNHRFNGRIEYDISEYNRLRITPRLSWQQNVSTALNSGQTALGSQLTNDFLNTSTSDRSAFRLSNDITYQHRFNDVGRSISIELETDYDNINGERGLDSYVNYYGEQISPDSINQNAITRTDEWDIELEVEFNEPIGNWGRWELEYEYNPRYNDASTRTFAFNPGVELFNRLDTALSNVFTNTYTRHELGTGMRVTLDSGNFVANMSLGYQLAQLDNDQLFPQALRTQTGFGGIVSRAFVRWEIDKGKNLRIFYRGDTDPPSVSQLQDVLDNSNPLRLRSGNPDLEQSYDHFVFMRYSQTNTANSSNLFMMFRGSLTQNFVGDAIYIAESEARTVRGIYLQPGAQLNLPVNLNQRLDANMDLNYGRQIEALKLNVNTDLSTGYARTPSLINDQLNTSNNFRVGLGLTLSSNISKNIDFTLSTRGNLNQVVNSLQDELNTQFFSQNSSFRVNFIFWKGIVLRSNVTHQSFSGLGEDFNQSFWLWNGSAGKKLFKNQRGEISLSVFDALRQNTSIQRNVSATFIEDVRNVVLQRYVMLNFVYQFRHFNGAGPAPDMERRGRGDRGRW